MKKNEHSLLLFLLSLCFSPMLFSQQTVSTTGGEANGNGGSVSYTVGQVAYVRNQSTDFSEAQGVQQAFEISVVTKVIELDGNLIETELYPNPTIDQLTLRVIGTSFQQLTYSLLNIQGQELLKGPLTGESTTIRISHLPAANYLVKVEREQDIITIFKLQKL